MINKFFRLLSLILVFNFSFFLFSYDFSDYDNEIIQKVMEFRFNTRSYNSPEEAISNLQTFHTQIHEASVQNKLGDEAKITADNMLYLAEYSYMYEKDPKSTELKPFITKQYNKIVDWNSNHPAADANPYYLLSAGDLINSTMQFLPQSQAIKLGLEEKDNYDSIVKTYSELSFGYINAALWYFFAPAIGGGSKAKSKEYLQNSVKFASNNYEKFYANIYYSQIFFEEKNMDECKNYLTAAEKLLPGNRYTAFIKQINDLGYSLLYYSNNREKVDAKLNK